MTHQQAGRLGGNRTREQLRAARRLLMQQEHQEAMELNMGRKARLAEARRLSTRKQASAEIAKIPFPLAQHIARVFKP